MHRKLRIGENIDWFLIITYGILVFMGWINIYSASYNPSHSSIFDLSQEYGKQFMWIGISAVLAFVLLIFEGEAYRRFAPLIYGITLLLLVLVLIFGKEVNGAKAWFGFGSFGIQPSEFSKIGTSLILAFFLSQTGIRFEEFRTKFIVAVFILIPAALIMLQPDTGTVLVFTAFVLVLYREGLSGNILLFGLLAIVLAVSSLILKPSLFDLPFSDAQISGQYLLMVLMVLIGGTLFLLASRLTRPRNRKKFKSILLLITIGGLAFIATVDQVVENVLDSHQRVRINILLGLEEDPQGAGYNVKQSQTAIGSGGFSGKGYLDGTLTKYKYVPMQSTDFIFCTVGEEWGFIGSSVVIILFLTLMLRIIFLAERQRSVFTRIYGYCVGCILFMHLLINVGMAIGLAPVIGIPLPFFSYGGSSLMSFTILLFILIRLDSERLTMLR